MKRFDLNREERSALFNYVINRIENYYEHTGEFRVTPVLEPEGIREFVHGTGRELPAPALKVLERVMQGMEEHAVHTPHPKYFGLFNPRAGFAGILADLITASYNPQLAAWSHSPFAAEVENYCIRAFGSRFGFREENTDGVFATGGAEANQTAMLCALNSHFPGFKKYGLRSLPANPVLYCSSEAHHSVTKAAQTAGLGSESVRLIPVHKDLRMDTNALAKAIEKDRSGDAEPFMVVGTAGTTGTGAIDDLATLSDIARKNNLWHHVDAAYGGAAILHEGLKPNLRGIGNSDSITFDAHKWLSVPMATSMFITRHRQVLAETFGQGTQYMPRDAEGLEIVDPYAHSIQWSRRFNGLKVYLSLAIYGWEGYGEVIGHQAAMGDLFRKKLTENRWVILNHTPLPVICFSAEPHLDDPAFANAISQNIVRSGKSWISVYPVHGNSAIRVCITNYNTGEAELDELVGELNEERNLYQVPSDSR